MSTQRKTDFVADSLSDREVHDFLEQNPDFFERHNALLGTLRLPHVAGGTVSLVTDDKPVAGSVIEPSSKKSVNVHATLCATDNGER